MNLSERFESFIVDFVQQHSVTIAVCAAIITSGLAFLGLMILALQPVEATEAEISVWRPIATAIGFATFCGVAVGLSFSAMKVWGNFGKIIHGLVNGSTFGIMSYAILGIYQNGSGQQVVNTLIVFGCSIALGLFAAQIINRKIDDCKSEAMM